MSKQVKQKVVLNDCGVIAIGSDDGESVSEKFQENLFEKVLGPLQGVFARERAKVVHEKEEAMEGVGK